MVFRESIFHSMALDVATAEDGFVFTYAQIK